VLCGEAGKLEEFIISTLTSIKYVTYDIQNALINIILNEMNGEEKHYLLKVRHTKIIYVSHVV